ncbi:RBP11-like subunits of RNA polymerase [Coccomyxa subellipsoidea C-169]|uniref:RBP11-like subunits of RNA polymerase n=1 Tax=Coccomyxa subellipsoidea (strain C-169) TaxID=574566 RepID=I0YIN6_COCSC|nr:RBP11-like subunits of RNA polymerase [Coccomyxa subellipsoidea C-169]EIE18255.1 RBP11-like subunits of RNA polymerase [Coccomyxa subellipsoidea C-169]|eukprot:XP_005642799.1 RBP11-like subunits of RNA polymerase [Coccomyxa subellipsoidea C-169]
MNAPDRFERFVVPDGVPKISLEKDTKVTNAATFTLQREDHTVGNLVRMQLLRDKEVTFAGYKFPHPLDYHILIKVQTKGKKSPREVMDDALTDLCDEFEDIRAKFQAEARRIHSSEAGPMYA